MLQKYNGKVLAVNLLRLLQKLLELVSAISRYFCGMPRRLQLKFSPQEASSLEYVERQFLSAAGIGTDSHSATVAIRKKSLDARGKNPYFLISADVYLPEEKVDTVVGFRLRNVSNVQRTVHIVGAGPAGLFAALALIELGIKPIVIERGKSVKNRRRDLAKMNRELEVNPDSNYCFGEGGAGTYSDGKLYTRSNKRGPVEKVLQCLIEHGAPPAIAWEAHPHIGTNKLPQLVESIRDSILAYGGEVRFNSKLVDLEVESGRGLVHKVKIQSLPENESPLGLSADGYWENCETILLATGHSARDIFELLNRKRVVIESKPFALGVRLEHPQELIDSIQYKCDFRGDFLPPSTYSLVEQVQGKGVFSFCMCPGGIIAPAATDGGEVVVNGWSPSKRNGKFANSGFVVGVDDGDFKPFAEFGELRALRYQQAVEQAAFATTESLVAPAQRMEDFIQRKVSDNLPPNSYLPGLKSVNLDHILPLAVHQRIRESLLVLGKKMKGFRTNNAILVGVESRTSSPVRIPRDTENLHHPQYENLYPCGEGAGYAGGIMSAALDGMRLAQVIAVSK